MTVQYDNDGDVLSVTAENVEAAVTGSTREALEALRNTLAAAIDTCSMNMLPQIAGQYRNVLSDIADLDAKEKPNAGKPKTKHNELAEKRREKQLRATG